MFDLVKNLYIYNEIMYIYSYSTQNNFRRLFYEKRTLVLDRTPSSYKCCCCVHFLKTIWKIQDFNGGHFGLKLMALRGKFQDES